MAVVWEGDAHDRWSWPMCFQKIVLQKISFISAQNACVGLKHPVFGTPWLE